MIRKFAALLAGVMTLSSGLADVSASPVSNSLSPLAPGFLERAKLMMKEGNYAGVIDQIEFIHTDGIILPEEQREECLFLLAIALYQRGDASCIDCLREFADTYPASPKSMKARLAAADWFFYAGHYSNAIAAYADIDPERLDPADRMAYTYRKALSMVKSGLLDEAIPLLRQLRDNTEYNVASDYYLAYIAYAKGDYNNALEGFKKVERKLSRTDGNGIYPEYYITQINYWKGDFNSVISNGLTLLKNPADPTLVPETQRVVGLSYFKTGNLFKAQEYLSKYLATPEYSTAPDATYALGEILYSEGEYLKAARMFENIIDEDNELGQGAYLYLGQIAIKEGDTDASTLFFEKASGMDYDSAITETALYNYVVARTQGGNIPFSSSVPLLEKFAEKYPRSQYFDEVQDYLASAYYNEKDYANALKSIERIQYPSQDVVDRKQKILFELGAECVATGRRADAIRYLEESVKIGTDKSVTSQSWLWLADAYYSQGKYSNAENACLNYLKLTPKGENRALAYYDLGYARLMQDKFSMARDAFDAAMRAEPGLSKNLHDDALVRLADTQYYTGDYRTAMKNYSYAISSGVDESDYAHYRRALMYGLAGDTSKKISELTAMETLYPNSRWLSAALLETGQTYTSLGDTDNAVKVYERLRKVNASGDTYRAGLVDLAASYMKRGDYKQGEETYREILKQWPTSEEAVIANEDLRTYYAEYGGLREYADFLHSIPGAPAIDENEIEKLEFEAAANAYADNATDTEMLEKYVSNYPAGRYLAESLFYIASADMEKGNNDKALESIDRLLQERRDAPQVPEAISMKARILEEKGVRYTREALEAYKELEQRGGLDFSAEAYSGIMRLTSDEDERLKYARLVKTTGGVPAETLEEAELYEATALLNQGDKEAPATLLRLAGNTKSLAGAKAAVTLGQYYLDSGNMAKAEEILKDFTTSGTPHQYWLARGFITLADTYHKSGKDYLAIEYIKSLQSNYPGRELDIQDMISTRLKKWSK